MNLNEAKRIAEQACPILLTNVDALLAQTYIGLYRMGEESVVNFISAEPDLLLALEVIAANPSADNLPRNPKRRRRRENQQFCFDNNPRLRS